MSGATQPDDQVEVPHIMRALDPEVFDAVFEAVSPLLPDPDDRHPLGCHRPRVPDRVCLWALLVRLVTGCSWVDAERLVGGVSDTTLRSRRDEWANAGVFERLALEMLSTYRSEVGLELGDTLVDASIHKAPCGGDGTGKSPVDRGKLGWKWSIATDGEGIPIGWLAEAANRNDSILLPATLAEVSAHGLTEAIGTLHLDRGYDTKAVRVHVAKIGIERLVCAKQRRREGPGSGSAPLAARQSVPLGKRWPVERTNSWLSNYGQLRRNTDRCLEHRRAQLAFAIAILLIVKLDDRRRSPYG